MANLSLSMVVSTPAGGIELMAAPYDLHADTLASVPTTWRKKKVTNPHVEGSFTTHAERDNPIVPVAVWVEAARQSDLRDALSRLEDAFSQLAFTITFRVEDSTSTWNCQVSDSVIEMQAAYLHAHMGLFRAQVDRMPSVTYS